MGSSPSTDEEVVAIFRESDRTPVAEATEKFTGGEQVICL